MNQKSMKLSEMNILDLYGSRFPIQQADVTRATDNDTSDIEELLHYRGVLERSRLQAFTIEHCARRILPYGIWHCQDGREVVFNREYQPIAQRHNGVVGYADRDTYVGDIVRAVMIYDDLDSPIEYLLKHLGVKTITDGKINRMRRKALLRSLRVLRDFTPREHVSVARRVSLVQV